MHVANNSRVRKLQPPNYFHVAVAAMVAVIAHVGLLLLPKLNLDTVMRDRKSPAVQITLVKEEPAEQINELPTPVQPAKEAPTQNEEPKNIVSPTQSLISRPLKDETIEAKKSEITMALFERWSEQEEERQTSPQSAQQLESFQYSFLPTPSLPKETIESHKNPYGELHVKTKVGGKDVCYMQDNPIVKDEWSTNIVMFYKCKTTPEFSLDLR